MTNSCFSIFAATLAGSLVAPMLALADSVTYTVPVPDSLKAFAQFNVPAQLTKSTTGISVSYQMPPELVGSTPLTVTLKSDGTYSGSSFHVSGPQAQGDCQEINDTTSCNLKFSNLNLDKNDISETLRQTSSTAQEFTSRLQVASLFGDDPVGVLVYTTNMSQTPPQ